MTIEGTISLLASVGACLAAVAAFLTVREMTKQRRLMYRPDLAFIRTNINGYCIQSAKDPFPSNWLLKELTEYEPNHRAQPLYLHVFNIGLGPAKQVSIRWELPVEKWLGEINARSQRSLAPLYLEYENGCVKQSSNKFPTSTLIWKNEINEDLDLVMPSHIKEGASVRFPWTYIHLISIHMYFSFQYKEFGVFDPPPLALHLSYYDLDGAYYQTTHNIALDLIVYFSGSDDCQPYFRGFLEFTKPPPIPYFRMDRRLFGVVQRFKRST